MEESIKSLRDGFKQPRSFPFPRETPMPPHACPCPWTGLAAQLSRTLLGNSLTSKNRLETQRHRDHVHKMLTAAML